MSKLCTSKYDMQQAIEEGLNNVNQVLFIMATFNKSQHNFQKTSIKLFSTTNPSYKETSSVKDPRFIKQRIDERFSKRKIAGDDTGLNTLKNSPFSRSCGT